MPRKFWGIIESVKILVILNPTGWLHVDIFRFCFHSFEVYAVDSSKMIGNPPPKSRDSRILHILNSLIYIILIGLL